MVSDDYGDEDFADPREGSTDAGAGEEKTKPSGFKRLLLNLYVLAVLAALLLSIVAGPVVREFLVAIAGILVISPVIILFFSKKGRKLLRRKTRSCHTRTEA